MATAGVSAPNPSRISYSTAAEDQVPAPGTIVWKQPCTLKGISAGLGAGVLGYVFGVLPSVLRNRTFKARGTWHADGITSFAAFALMSGLYAGVHCLLIRIRETDDAINRGLAGAASGLVIGWNGGPMSALQSAGFIGVLSYAFDFGESSAHACCSSCATDSMRSRPPAALGPGVSPGQHQHAAQPSTSPFASFSLATAKLGLSGMPGASGPGCDGEPAAPSTAGAQEPKEQTGTRGSSPHTDGGGCGSSRMLVVRHQRARQQQGSLPQSPLMWLGSICNSSSYFDPAPQLAIGMV
ncbi:MAG: hypothetical protein WDW36_005323 [Sanguina aurantia]